MTCPFPPQRTDFDHVHFDTRPAYSPGGLVPDCRILYDMGFRHRGSLSPRRGEFRIRLHVRAAPGAGSVALRIDVGFWSDFGVHRAAYHGDRWHRRLHADQGKPEPGARAG